MSAAFRLFSQTEGNPLFVVETVRAGLPPSGPDAETSGRSLPPKVHAVITGRLEPAHAGGREVAGLAAVIGRAFSIDILTAASDLDEARVTRALDELWQRRIVRDGGAVADNADRRLGLHARPSAGGRRSGAQSHPKAAQSPAHRRSPRDCPRTRPRCSQRGDRFALRSGPRGRARAALLRARGARRDPRLRVRRGRGPAAAGAGVARSASGGFAAGAGAPAAIGPLGGYPSRRADGPRRGSNRSMPASSSSVARSATSSSGRRPS